LSDLNTRMPFGSDVIQRTDMKPAFSAHLLEPILQPSNILQACKRVRANKGAVGIDGMTIDDFPTWARNGNWKRIMSELRSGKDQPSPVRRVEIDKPDGGKRQLSIPTIVDRVIQKAIAQVLTPIFDLTFSDNSFGFRPNRNGQQAVKQLQSIIKTGRSFAVDLSKFFDRVDHDLLMTHLGHKVKDKKVYRKAGHCFLCWQTSCLTLWTKNSRNEVTRLLVTRMTLPYWLRHHMRENVSLIVSAGS
jgi:RNA-directed DNA polymerase